MNRLKQYQNLHQPIILTNLIWSLSCSFHLNLNVGDAADDDFKSASPRVQISGSDSLRAQDVGEIPSESLEERTIDTAGLVTVSHVLDLAEELEGVVHRADDVVEAVSNEFNLGVVSGVRGQLADGDLTESAELGQGGGVLSEEPNVKCIVYLTFVLFSLDRGNLLDEDLADDGVAVIAVVFPSASDIGDLVGSQTGLGISNVFLLPVELIKSYKSIA